MVDPVGVFMPQGATTASSGVEEAPALCDTCGREPDTDGLGKETLTLQNQREVSYWRCGICREEKIEMRLVRVAS